MAYSETLMQPREGGGISVAITATTVEQTGLIPGELLRFAACGGSAVVEWGAANATVADGGYSFAVPAGAIIDIRVPAGIVALNVLEADTTSDGSALLCITPLDQV